MSWIAHVKRAFDHLIWPTIWGGGVLAALWLIMPEVFQAFIMSSIVIFAGLVVYVGGSFALGIFIRKAQEWIS